MRLVGCIGHIDVTSTGSCRRAECRTCGFLPCSLGVGGDSKRRPCVRVGTDGPEAAPGAATRSKAAEIVVKQKRLRDSLRRITGHSEASVALACRALPT